MPEPRSVESLYDSWSASYDADPNRTRDLAYRVLRGAGLELAGRQVLELGCGTGGNTGWLAEQARGVLALDFSEGMLAVARERVAPQAGRDGAADAPAHRTAPVHFLRHDIRQPLPVRHAAVDLVLILLVLEHVARVAPVIAECARVLRPGGELFVCEYHPYRQLRGGQARFSSGADEEVRIPAFLHMAEEFVNGCVAAGLRIEGLGEWWDEGAEPGTLPRVLSLQAVRP